MIKKNVMKEVIGKTRKSEPHLPGKISIHGHEVSGKKKITNEFHTFTDNGQSWSKKYQMHQGHLKVIFKKAETTMPTDSLTINKIQRGIFLTENKQKCRV